MPEAFAVLLVVMVAVGVYIGARIYSRNPANHNAPRELARLREHEAWLRQRLETAERERWSRDMVERISNELEAISQQVARAAAESRG